MTAELTAVVFAIKCVGWFIGCFLFCIVAIWGPFWLFDVTVNEYGLRARQYWRLCPLWHQPYEPSEADILALDSAPVGTIAPSLLGGGWIKVPSGWQETGAARVVRRLDSYWTGELIPPKHQ